MVEGLRHHASAKLGGIKRLVGGSRCSASSRAWSCQHFRISCSQRAVPLPEDSGVSTLRQRETYAQLFLQVVFQIQLSTFQGLGVLLNF